MGSLICFRKNKTASAQRVETVNITVPEFEHKVITFEDGKRHFRRGLYPSEIFLLEYCSKGTYPETITNTMDFCQCH